MGRGVLLEPLVVDVDAWFQDMDRLGAGSELPCDREQPLAPVRDIELG
jgi:hypothetical protein